MDVLFYTGVILYPHRQNISYRPTPPPTITADYPQVVVTAARNKM